MKKCPYTTQRERIVAEAISPVATELRLLDAADLISLLRFELYGNIADLVSSAAELYFHPGTVNFGAGGEYRLEWGGVPEVVLDLEIAEGRDDLRAAEACQRACRHRDQPHRFPAAVGRSRREHPHAGTPVARGALRQVAIRFALFVNWVTVPT
jgi:hypothetical protein